jgi:hypothetical protein
MRDSVTETILTRDRIEFDYVEEVKLGDIEIDDAAKSNIRLTEALNDEVIRGYRVALDNSENGYKAALPAIVLHIRDRGPQKYGMIDGIQRSAATQENGIDVLDAYVVRTTDINIINGLRRTLNAKNGWRSTEMEKIQQGIFLVEQNGYTPADAERQLFLKGGLISNRIRSQGISDVLSQNRSAPPKSQRLILLTGLLRNREEVMVAVNNLRNEADLGAQAYEEVVRDVLSKYSDGAQLKAVERWQEHYKSRIEETRGGRYSLPGKNIRKMHHDILRLNRQIDKAESPSLLPQEELRTMIEDLDKIIAKLTSARQELRDAVFKS